MMEPIPYQAEEVEVEAIPDETPEPLTEKPLELPSHDRKPPVDDDDAVQMTLEF
ncbi:MAG: hypothetical protein HGA37_11010, partial [Lentimicrobium sp.]|nr:hypothetical protein [Lentimicrobium sp.]